MSLIKPIKRDFTSDIDIALKEFDSEHEPSTSQQREIDKYQAIFKKRDNPNLGNDEKEDLWTF